MDKTMLQGTVYEGRCYEMVLRRTAYDGQIYEEMRHLRNGYMNCPLTGGEPSRLKITQRHSNRGWTAFPSSEFSSRRAVSTRRRTEDEAGSPRVADRSGPVAVLPSSPLVLYQ